MPTPNLMLLKKKETITSIWVDTIISELQHYFIRKHLKIGPKY